MKNKVFVFALALFLGFGAFLAGAASSHNDAKAAIKQAKLKLEQDFKQELDRRLKVAKMEQEALKREIEVRKRNGGWTELELGLLWLGEKCPDWAVDAMAEGSAPLRYKCVYQVERRKNGTH